MIYTLDLNTHILKRKQSPKRYWKFVKEYDILGTAITEHVSLNPKKAYLDLLKYKPNNKILIPGLTVTTDYGDVIIYGSNEEIYEYSIFFEEKVSLNRLCDFCKKKKFLISIAHPFGKNITSATYIIGISKLEKFIKNKDIGVEIYNGIIGYLSFYMYDSFFIRKLNKLLFSLKLNKLINILGLSSTFEKINHKINSKSYEVIYKFSATIKLGKLARYVTGGSGAEHVYRIGDGLIYLDLPKNIIEEKNNYKQNLFILDKIRHKKIKAIGPPGTYTDEHFERSKKRIVNKRKAYKDLMYLTKNSIK